MRNNLTDLKLAIEGTIVMSDNLRGLLDAMYDARVPELWDKLSWQSTTLGFWYTELLERDAQFRRWCFNGRPKVFWVTGFFNPQGFLTAMRQEVTRSHKGWALDSVICQNLVTRFAKEDIHDSPPEGVYIHGKILRKKLNIRDQSDQFQFSRSVFGRSQFGPKDRKTGGISTQSFV